MDLPYDKVEAEPDDNSQYLMTLLMKCLEMLMILTIWKYHQHQQFFPRLKFHNIKAQKLEILNILRLMKIALRRDAIARDTMDRMHHNLSKPSTTTKKRIKYQFSSIQLLQTKQTIQTSTIPIRMIISWVFFFNSDDTGIDKMQVKVL